MEKISPDSRTKTDDNQRDASDVSRVTSESGREQAQDASREPSGTQSEASNVDSADLKSESGADDVNASSSTSDAAAISQSPALSQSSQSSSLSSSTSEDADPRQFDRDIELQMEATADDNVRGEIEDDAAKRADIIASAEGGADGGALSGTNQPMSSLTENQAKNSISSSEVSDAYAIASNPTASASDFSAMVESSGGGDTGISSNRTEDSGEPTEALDPEALSTLASLPTGDGEDTDAPALVADPGAGFGNTLNPEVNESMLSQSHAAENADQISHEMADALEGDITHSNGHGNGSSVASADSTSNDDTFGGEMAAGSEDPSVAFVTGEATDVIGLAPEAAGDESDLQMGTDETPAEGEGIQTMPATEPTSLGSELPRGDALASETEPQDGLASEQRPEGLASDIAPSIDMSSAPIIDNTSAEHLELDQIAASAFTEPEVDVASAETTFSDTTNDIPTSAGADGDGDLVEEEAASFDTSSGVIADAVHSTARVMTGAIPDDHIDEDSDFAVTANESADGPIASQAIVNELAGGEIAPDLQLDGAETTEPDTREEIEMIRAHLPDAYIEAGDQLMTDIRGIPDKMAFKIGEAAEMVGVKQYVLRYWETEFDALKPKKSKNGQRVYSRRDIETAMMIRKLLYDDRFSIEGARSAMRSLKSQVKEEKNIRAITESQETAVMKLHKLVDEIRRVKEMFS